FLPGIPRAAARRWLEPAVVTDPSDPRLAHLDGLNLSRAWMLEGIASGLRDDPRLPALRAAAAAHREAGLASVTGEHYEGGHWLGTFAVYLVSGRGTGRPVPAAAGPARATDAATALQQLFKDAWENDLREDPVSATRVGDHRYDDRLAGATVADYERRAAAARGFLDRLLALDRSSLGARDRVSYDVFRRLEEGSLAEFEHRVYLVPITNREGFHVDFARLPAETRFADAADYEHYLARLRAFPEHVRQQIATMRQGIATGYTLPRVALEGVEGSISAHVKDPEQTVFFAPFRSFPPAVAEADRQRLTEAGRRAIAEAVVPAYREFLEFVQREYVPSARTTIGASALPNGRAFYEHRVRQETTLEIAPEEVHRIGLAEVERIRREMQAVIDKIGFRGTFREFLDSLRSDPRFYVDTPERLLAEASLICKRMDGELPRLFLRLPRLPYGITPIPDFIAPKTTGAYYGPGSGDGTRAGTYFVNTYDLKSRPLYVLEALSFHESVPGHHL
ncbi:MAG TPA: DUF885 family protein, partial [Vicinamibacteria bacterium]